jgi:hypothetical protein
MNQQAAPNNRAQRRNTNRGSISRRKPVIAGSLLTVGGILGAYLGYVRPPAAFAVSCTETFTPDGIEDSAALESAITTAGDAGTVCITGDFTMEADVTITSSVTLIGNNSSDYPIIDGYTETFGLKLDSSISIFEFKYLEFRDMSLNGGSALNVGSRVGYNNYAGAHSVEISNCDFTSNVNGALEVMGPMSSLMITDSTFTGNGGDSTVFVFEAEGLKTLTISGTSFTGNTPGKDGTLNVRDSGDDLYIKDSQFTNNVATAGTGRFQSGAALYSYGDVKMRNVDFTGNKTLGIGAHPLASAIGIGGSGAYLDWDDVVVTGNGDATIDRPAVSMPYGKGTITNSRFSNNLSSGAIKDLYVGFNQYYSPLTSITSTSVTSRSTVLITPGAVKTVSLTYLDEVPADDGGGSGGDSGSGGGSTPVASDPTPTPTAEPSTPVQEPATTPTDTPAPVIFTDPGEVVPAEVSVLTPAQVASIPYEQFKDLTPEVFGVLTAEQVSELPIDLVRAIRPARLAALEPAAVSGMSGEQLSSLRLASMRAMSPEQVQAISAEAMTQIAPVFLAQLKPKVLAALDTDVLAALSPQQAAAIRPAALAKLPVASLRALAPESFGALSVRQLAKLTTRQVARLTTQQLAVLNPAQRRSLRRG